jgi:hypothetical protein
MRRARTRCACAAARGIGGRLAPLRAWRSHQPVALHVPLFIFALFAVYTAALYALAPRRAARGACTARRCMTASHARAAVTFAAQHCCAHENGGDKSMKYEAAWQ